MRTDEELLRQNDELAALHDTTLDLLNGLDLDELLEAVVARAAALVDTDSGYLYMASSTDGRLRVRVATGTARAFLGLEATPGQGVAGRVLETREPVLVDDYEHWSGQHGGIDARGLHAIIGVPLEKGQELLGVLGLLSTDPGRTFGANEIELLRRFGKLAALAIENARLYATARQEIEERLRAEDELQDTVMRLTQSQTDLRITREEMIRRLSAAAEFRDAGTGRHVERMSRYCALLGRALGLDEDRCELLRMASPLHDIGKIAISDGILNKPGPLTESERRSLEHHTEIGYRLLAGSRSELLEVAATIALTHHEWFDGTGYPRGLAREVIPIEGRIAGVADAFDALTSDRAFRPAFSVEAAFRLLEEERGTHFDPLVLDLFLGARDEVAAIRHGFGEGDRKPLEAIDPRRRRRRAERAKEFPVDCFLPEHLEGAAEEAQAILGLTSDDRQAIDAALTRLCQSAGPDLLASVYVRDLERLWLVSQHGYGEVRDGFPLDHGVMARALRTGKVQFLAEASSDHDFVPATSDLLSEVAIPFGDRLGVLNVETRRLRLPPEAATVFAGLARALGARAASMRADLGFDLAALARLFVYASSLRGVDSIAEFATRTLGRLLDLEAAQLNVGREGTGYMLASFWRTPESALQPLEAADVERLAGLVESGETAYSVLDPRAAGVTAPEDGVQRFVVWLPLLVGGEQIGALVGCASHGLTMQHANAEAATLFAPHAAALIDVAQALRREQRAAVTDALTGLLNRRGFEQRFQEEIQRAERADRELAVIIVDCDGLKAINDRGGHELGDNVLLSVARCLRAGKRSGDIAARLGGDEFAVLLPEIDPPGALAAGERLRASLVENTLGGQLVTATFGIASYPADGRTRTDLLRAADQALYAGKAAGRNRCLLFGDAVSASV